MARRRRTHQPTDQPSPIFYTLWRCTKEGIELDTTPTPEVQEALTNAGFSVNVRVVAAAADHHFRYRAMCKDAQWVDYVHSNWWG